MNNKKKINLIIFHPYSSVGGADLSLSKLINNLDLNSFNIEFICLNKENISRLINKKIKIHIIKSRRTFYTVFKFRKIIKENIKKDYKKTIILTNQNFANVLTYFFTINLRNKIKIIGIERNHISELNFHENFQDYFKKKILKLLIRFVYRRLDRIVGNSKELSKDLSNYLKINVLTLQNQFNIKKLKSYKKKNNIILNVGRLEFQKDQITIIKALNYVVKFRNIKLIIVGNGSKYYEIKQQIRRYGLKRHVQIIRNSKNPKKYFQKSKLFIFSSLYEGFPNVLIESIENGVPVISSSCKSGPKEILSNYKKKDFFKIGDHNELSKKILNHFKEPNYLQSKIEGIHKSFKKYDQKKISSQYLDLFLNI